MAIGTFREFLESSTIHGLAHISTSKSKAGRLAWVVIVVTCFAIAITMITSSYKEWQESPVSTTITTHPISELEFPTVTVCPPRGSNTALNHLLEKVKDVNFNDEERQELLGISNEVFIKIPNKKFAKQMAELVSDDHMRSIVNGQSRMPEVDEEGMITLISFQPEGNFSTPGFLDSDYKGDFFRRPQSLNFVLALPNNVEEMVGEGAPVISMETEGNWTWSRRGNWNWFQGERFRIHDESMSHDAAEKYCVSQGGHLASVGSERELDQIKKVVEAGKGHHRIWLGGRRIPERGVWQWLDGTDWDFQNGKISSTWGGHCLYQYKLWGWFSRDCNENYPFICANPRTTNRRSGSHTMVLGQDLLKNPTFYFWWSHNPDDSSTSKMPGFKLSWRVKNGSLPSVRKDQRYNPVEDNRNVLALMKMVREVKRNNVSEKDVWKSLLKHRWSSEIIKDSPCLNETQEYQVILETAQELNLNRGASTSVPDEVIVYGKELYSVIKCQFPVVTVAKLSQLFNHLLTNQSLNTVVAATMYNIQPIGGNDIKDFTAINMWYEMLDKRYNWSLAPVILPMLKTDALKQLAELDPPYLKDFKASIHEHQHGNTALVFGKINLIMNVKIPTFCQLEKRCFLVSPLHTLYMILGRDSSLVSHPPHLTSNPFLPSLIGLSPNNP